MQAPSVREKTKTNSKFSSTLDILLRAAINVSPSFLYKLLLNLSLQWILYFWIFVQFGVVNAAIQPELWENYYTIICGRYFQKLKIKMTDPTRFGWLRCLKLTFQPSGHLSDWQFFHQNKKKTFSQTRHKQQHNLLC